MNGDDGRDKILSEDANPATSHDESERKPITDGSNACTNIYDVSGHFSRDLSSLRFEFVTVSCYRTGNILSTRTDNLDLSVAVTPEFASARITQIFARFFYPIWVLQFLWPMLENLGTQTLAFDNLVFAYAPKSLWPNADIFDAQAQQLQPPKCSLTINCLTMVCTADTQDSASHMKDEFLKLFDKLAIKCLDFVVKPLFVSLDSLSPVKDFIALFKDLSNIRCLSQDPAQDPLEYASPHVMFGSCSAFHYKVLKQQYQYRELYKDIDGDGILIATLGYGCNPNLNSDELPIIDDNWSFDRDIAPPVLDENEAYTVNWHIHEYTKSSRFVVCRTTNNYGIIANSINQQNYGIGDDDHSLDDLPIGSATAEAIKWLRKKWKLNTWKWTDKDGSEKCYDNLIILIPYGGQYREDEMIQITKATDEGIIIVCAAGDCHDAPNTLPFQSESFLHDVAWKGTKTRGNVVFPAALGTVISVGVADIGPSGREIDVSVDFSKAANRHILSANCGIAAAKITGLISLLLSSINKALENPPDDNSKEIVRLIKEKANYMHTCVIRELLVNEGNGSHDPQLGYGDGEEILRKLLSMESSTLIQKMANILFKRHQEFCRSERQTGNKEYKQEYKKIKVSMKGMNFAAAIIDKFTNFEDIQKSKGQLHKTTFIEFKGTHITSHGEKCASIVKSYCPDATIQCANVCKERAEQKVLPIDMAHAFEDCIDPDDENTEFDAEMQLPYFFDVISCSISLLSFDHNLCIAVNKAVMAGKIIVFAAGNMGLSQRNTIGYPGRIGNVIVIGGRDQYFNRAGFSSIGREMDFLAEGEQFGDGTSFAAPVVAGYIILILEFIQNKMKATSIKAWSTYNAENPGSPHREYNWRDIPAFKAAQNVYAMRAILKLLVPKPQEHSEREGFGCLDLTTLFPSYLNENKEVQEFVDNEAKKQIYNTLQNFYYAGQGLLS